MANNDQKDTRIEVSVARIETLLKGYKDLFETHLEQQAIINTRLAAQNERHAKFIYGSDDSSNPGARVRMDRLEQSERRRSAIANSALGGMILLVLKQLWEYMTHPGGPPAG